LLHEGQQVELTIEKPASGGRMIARHHGQVVLVRGAIPGERVAALIEKADRQLAFAVTRDVIEPSPDRRPAGVDPLCGGALYNHIEYPRQLAIKADVIQDAFTRLARYPLESVPAVAPSPEHGYRTRARFHMQGTRSGYYREGTHQLCEAAPTGQLSQEMLRAMQAVTDSLNRHAAGAARSIAMTENIAGTQRAAHLDLAAPIADGVLERVCADSQVAGLTARGAASLSPGAPAIADPLNALAGPRAPGELRRHPESFFQGNRYLLPDLVQGVLDAVSEGPVLDLYAGVGLFSVALAATTDLHVTAVEGDRSSGADLVENARPYAPRLEPIVRSVEDYLRTTTARAATIVIDPPRTGVSKEAILNVIRQQAPRVVYVSCDPPTLARDARRLLDAGYALERFRAFDFFPNTPHVETLVSFYRASAR
jgi:23S rRNA (uracil1939-C5)-methyltransferase